MNIHSPAQRRPKFNGNVLLAAVVILGLSALTLLSYLSLIANQSQMSARSQAWNAALPLVEAGIEEALAHITSSQTNWAVNGWTGSQFSVRMRRSLDDGYYFVSVTNQTEPTIIAGGYVRAPLASDRYITRAVQVRAVAKPDLGPGLAARTTIELNGNKLTVDSFDSSDPAYRGPDGHFTPANRKDGATVVAAGGFVDAVNVGNADIWGKVATAPGGSVEVLKKGTVGTSEFHASGGTGIESGGSSDDASLAFTPISAPFSGSSPPVIGGVITLGSGIYEVGSLIDPVRVTGTASLIVRTSFDIDGTDAIVIEPGAKLTLYVYAATAKFRPGTYNFTTNSAATNLRYYGMPSNTRIEFNGNLSFVGVIYAPDADLSYNGGGNGLNIEGATTAKSITMNGAYNFHFDEALLKEAEPGYVITEWNEMLEWTEL